VYQKLLRSASWFALLQGLDDDLARQVGQTRCPYCGDKLHRADYERKPRGLPPRSVGRDWSRRHSFCCAVCRKRATPPSFRFLGRKVYGATVVVLVSALRCGPTPTRVEKLSELVGASRQTISRWIRWWQETFRETPQWRAIRGQLSGPIHENELPLSLLEQFVSTDVGERTRLMLRLLLPLTTTSWDGLAGLSI